LGNGEEKIMGFKDEAREAFANLVTRVEALESLAAQLKGSPVATPARRAEVMRPGSTPTTTFSEDRDVVDYGAVAFGLSEIKRKVAAAGVGSALQSEYVGAVQYFADVFAKSDPSFDVALFKRQSGV
jgi:hypothetical protein